MPTRLSTWPIPEYRRRRGNFDERVAAEDDHSGQVVPLPVAMCLHFLTTYSIIDWRWASECSPIDPAGRHRSRSLATETGSAASDQQKHQHGSAVRATTRRTGQPRQTAKA